MKILLALHQFLPDHWSGTEIIAYTTARELQRRGHDVSIVTAFPGDPGLRDDQRFDRYVYDGLEVFRYHHAFVPMGGQRNIVEGEYDNRLLHRFLCTMLADRRPDLVHFLHLGRLSSSAITACVELGIPAIFTATDFWLICPLNQLRLQDGSMCAGPREDSANCVKHLAMLTARGPVRATAAHVPLWGVAAALPMLSSGILARTRLGAYVKALARRRAFLLSQAHHLDRILVPSRVMHEMLTLNGVDPRQLTMLPYGIDLTRIVRNTKRGQGPNLRVVYVGTMAEHKGVDVLIRAFRMLPANTPVVLKLYGRLDQYPDYVAALRKDSEPDPRIEFCGPVDNQAIGSVLQDADLLVCPSIWYENTPLVILEALAAGVPVVASNLAGMSECVKDGVNGLLFDAGNSRQLANHLLTLAQDRSRLHTLASGTRPPLTIAGHVARLEAIYDNAIVARRA